MKTRIITALILLPILFGVLFLYKAVFFDILVFVVCVISVYEASFVFEDKNNKYLFLSCIPAIIAFIFKSYIGIFVLPIAFISIISIILFTIIKYTKINITHILTSIFLNILIIICFTNVIHYKEMFPYSKFGYDGIYYILLPLAFSWGGDTMAYFAGRFFGKRKLAPHISPKKTIEGAYGSVVGSVAFACLVTFIYAIIKGNMFVAPTFLSYFSVIIIAIFAAPLGIVGDLFASAIKRQADKKDYGTIFPGHGGFLDRFDSVLLTMPFITAILYVLTNF